MSTKGWFLKCFHQFSKILENLKGWPYVISDLTRKKGSISRGISHFRSECIFQFDEIQEWSFARSSFTPLIGLYRGDPSGFRLLATVSMAIGDSSCYTYRGFETTRTPADPRIWGFRDGIRCGCCHKKFGLPIFFCEKLVVNKNPENCRSDFCCPVWTALNIHVTLGFFSGMRPWETHQVPGVSSRDLFYPQTLGWSRLQPLSSGHVNSPSQKRSPAELPGFVFFR